MNSATVLDVLLIALSTPLAVFGLHRAWLLARFRPRTRVCRAVDSEREYPPLAVQLPLFNERAVAARAIRALGALEWPRERFEVQVLDDSTDDTREIVDREVERLRAHGVRASVVRRTSRDGFKAGALANGLGYTRSEVIAVFDADFVPAPDFAKRLVTAFDDPRVGMVQARWEHTNRDASWLTRAQATLLDGHFVITHRVRFERGLFFHFNGTAGIWRRSAIESAGGWQHDTLTEDLDLSYRAQLEGWRFAYASDVTAPAELPDDITALTVQQARWARGTVQVARKLSGSVLRARIGARVKLEALLHFATHSGHPLVLALVALVPLTLRTRDSLPHGVLAAVLVSCTPVVLLFHETAQRAIGRPFGKRMLDALLAFVLGLGLSVALTRATLRGLSREVGAFERTPKRGDQRLASYRTSPLAWPGIELAFAAWAGYGAQQAVSRGAWGALPFLVLYVAGFTWVGASSLRCAISARRSSRERNGVLSAARPLDPVSGSDGAR